VATPVTRDEFSRLENRMTVAESEIRDVSAKVEGAFAAVRRDIRGLRQEVASLSSLRGDVLALNTEMEDVQKTLRGHGEMHASHSEVLASHGEMLREILGILKKR
jgi:hypothetical protein